MKQRLRNNYDSTTCSPHVACCEPLSKLMRAYGSATKCRCRLMALTALRNSGAFEGSNRNSEEYDIYADGAEMLCNREGGQPHLSCSAKSGQRPKFVEKQTTTATAAEQSPYLTVRDNHVDAIHLSGDSTGNSSPTYNSS